MTTLIPNAILDDRLTSEERLFRALGQAEDRLSRLDERAKGCGFLSGWRERADLRAALGGVALQGETVHGEDLALHALGADIHVPDRGVVLGHALLKSRQKMWLGGEELLSWRGVAWVTGQVSDPPPKGLRPSLQVAPGDAGAGSVEDLERFFERMERRDSQTQRSAVEECLEVLDVAAEAPPLLAALALVEAWRLVEPFANQKAAGGLLASQYLRVRGRFTAGLFPLEVALQRRAMSPRLAWAPLLGRLTYWADLVTRSAELELDELGRLLTQKALLERRSAGGRRNGRAPALAALAVDRAVLTTEVICRELRMSPQGCGQLMRRFEGALQEITGRAAYRVWRL